MPNRVNSVRQTAALLLLLCAAILTPPAAADTTLVVGKAAATADAIIPVNVGDELGFFKKRGLALKIVDFNGGGPMVQALTAGSIDIADGAGTQMALEAKGAPMLAVCENTSTLPYFSIGVPWNSPVKQLADLKGKRLGISAAGSLTEWVAKQLALKEGWPPDALTIVAIGDSTTPAAAFRQNLIDADVGGTTTFLAMEPDKVGRVLAPVSAFVGNVASGVLYASNRLIKSNPDAVRAFLAGWLDTTRFIRAHKAETARIEAKVTGFPESVMAQEYDIVVGMFTPDCRFDPESLENLGRSFVSLKLLPKEPDLAKLYTDAYLPAK